jgi:hypothetical protein
MSPFTNISIPIRDKHIKLSLSDYLYLEAIFLIGNEEKPR